MSVCHKFLFGIFFDYQLIQIIKIKKLKIWQQEILK